MSTLIGTADASLPKHMRRCTGESADNPVVREKVISALRTHVQELAKTSPNTRCANMTHIQNLVFGSTTDRRREIVRQIMDELEIPYRKRKRKSKTKKVGEETKQAPTLPDTITAYSKNITYEKRQPLPPPSEHDELLGKEMARLYELSLQGSAAAKVAYETMLQNSLSPRG